MIQLGISLGGYLLIQFFTSWTYNILRCILAFKGKEAARAGASRVQAALGRHRPPLLPALDEFHRTQCFFSGAIQIAALVIIKDNNFGVSQALPIITNYSFIRVAAFNSITSVPFTFWYLKDEIKKSWYKYILTLSAFILSVATYTTATWYYQNFTPPSSGDEFSYCGNTDPTKQCAELEDDFRTSTALLFTIFGPQGAPILPALFTVYLTVEYFFSGAIAA
ncbi:MAG: hypothetical protein MMC23_004808 [Stictis urceolatum]|nr:hypothetical protein [Stictis urceolata]